MIATLFSFSALFLADLTLMTGLGLLGTLLSVRLTVEGFAPQTTGWVMGSYFLGLILGSFLCQRLIQRVGHIRAFAAFAAIATSIVMLHGLYLSALTWAAFRLLTGIAAFGLTMVIESWLNERTESRARGRIFALYLVMTYLGIGLGQQIINAADIRGATLFFVTGILMAMSLVPVAVTHSISPQLPTLKRVPLRKLFHQAPIGMWGCLAAGLSNGAFYAMGPVFAIQIGLNVSQVSWFMTATIFGGLILQWPVGLISDQFDRTKVLAALGFLMAAVSLGILIIAQISYAGFMIAMGLYGGIMFAIYPVAVARAHDLFEPNDIIPVSAGLLLAYSIGAAVGPVAASSVMALTGNPYGFFGFCFLCGASYALGTVSLRRKERVAIIAVEEQVDFVPMKDTSTIALMIDPRSEVTGFETDAAKQETAAE